LHQLLAAPPNNKDGIAALLEKRSAPTAGAKLTLEDTNAEAVKPPKENLPDAGASGRICERTWWEWNVRSANGKKSTDCDATIVIWSSAQMLNR
jgi:hypothetical protein